MRAQFSVSARGTCSRGCNTVTNSLFGKLREFCNHLRPERVEAWKSEKRSVTVFDQCRRLTALRADPYHYLRGILVGVADGPVFSVHTAFQAFCRHGGAPCVPPWKTLGQCRSIDVVTLGTKAIRKRRSLYVFPKLSPKRTYSPERRNLPSKSDSLPTRRFGR